MFYYLKGMLTYKGDNFIVLDIAGVGFKVYTSQTTLSNTLLNTETTVYTYTYVREDALDVFGFLSAEELNFFQKLIAISGVGPRLGLAILSTLSTQEIIIAVLSDDAKKIARTPGVGPKLAQRMILELKDKMKNEEVENAMYNQSVMPANVSEAVSALMVLGYGEAEAKSAVTSVGDNLSLEDTIKRALAILAR